MKSGQRTRPDTDTARQITPETGQWVMGHRAPDAGTTDTETGNRASASPGTGRRTTDAGRQTFDIGNRTLDTGNRCQRAPGTSQEMSETWN